MPMSKLHLLVVGAGDVAGRALAMAGGHYQATVLVRRAQRAAELTAAGRQVLTGDLDQPESLLAALSAMPRCDLVLHCAPPPSSGTDDPRTANLLAALDTVADRFQHVKSDLPQARGILPRRLVYVSTSGVYGDCQGALVDESRPVAPATARAQRRVAAEARLQVWAAARGAELVILRAPGIYAADRLPLERLRRGLPVLRDEDDVYTNHIHADDLAGACLRGLEPNALPGVYNATDDSVLRMGEWMDRVADCFGLPRPARVSRAEAQTRIDPGMLSFMGESRRLVNARLKQEMGYLLRYPTVEQGLAAARPAPIV